jgi:hypothetical protein
MKNIYLLIIRIIVSIILASIISVIFFKGIHPVKTPALAAGLLIFAYIFEQSRHKG